MATAKKATKTEKPVESATTVAPSRVQQIAELDVGKSFTLTERLDGDAATKEVIVSTRERLLNTMAAAVKRARDRSGNKYVVENGEITSRSLDLLVCVTATRIE